MIPLSLHPSRLALGICSAFFLLALVYAASTPPFEAPDEGSHFLYIHNLLQTGELPILEDRDTVFASQSVQRHHPPLYYLIGAALISGTQRDDVDTYLQRNPQAAIGFVSDNNINIYLHPYPAPSGGTANAITLLRLYSIALATGTVWLVYRVGYLASDDARVGLSAALLTASIPTFIHISASINNDNLVTFLFAAGVYGCLRVWKYGLTRGDMFALSLIAGGIALTKTNGLALFAVIYGTLIIGLWLKRWTVRQALITLGATLLSAGIIAGWWYLRNQQLYGDPLALSATLRIWSRGGPAQLISLFELKGVWDSFWFTLAHLSLRGPGWLLDAYLPLLILLAIPGLVLAFLRQPAQRLRYTFLLLVGVLVFAALLTASSRINVSQGRILYPGLVAYAPLIVIGLRQLLRHLSLVALLPLTLIALSIPALYLAPAFPIPAIITDLPPTATRIDATSDELTLLAYDLHEASVTPGDWLHLTLYLRGANPQNPLLFVKALDPLTQDVIGGVDTYPAMMPTDTLQEESIYAVPLRFRVGDVPGLMGMQLALGWRVPDEDNDALYLPMTDASENTINTLLVSGPTFVNPTPLTAAPQYPADVTFGDQIRLNGTTLSDSVVQPGDHLGITLYWQPAATMADDWTLSLGLLDASGALVAQTDGMPAGYPTSAWMPDIAFADTRTLAIPADLPPGQYRLYAAWYRLADNQRLQPVGTDVQGDIYLHPVSIKVE